LLPFHWAVKIGELTLTPRERALDECDRIVRDIAQPPGGRFKNPHSPDNVLSFGVTCASQI